MDGDTFEHVPPVQPLPDQGASDAGFLVVGVGASAGGIEALQQFFAHVPANSGMAYVVILHLSPDHDSQLAQVVQTVTPIPVTQVTERVLVEPNHVYVIPPNQHLLMLDGSLAVSPTTTIEERRAPVDLFFRSLAESHGVRAVGVVLSGTGANGSMGLKRIKERGGAVFVQEPREAAYDEMPRNAIATNLVDEVLPVAAIPSRVAAYRASLGRVAIPVQAEQRSDEQQQALREVLLQLRMRTGHDFSQYKRPTLLRRIERRISVRSLPDLPSYAAFLTEHPDEAQALLKDLLISVTNFFRDSAAFAALEQEIVPHILRGKAAQDEVRLWVVGCATGEEAYSLAMLLAERTLDMLDAPKVQIFATDIDEAALAHARQGLYTLNDAADISPERLRHFFSPEGSSYRVRPEIREMVLFANHNVLKDPPFSHLDLVTCRNVLIYLNRAAQERVIETLHFALDSGGYLMLGTSETVDGASDLFAPISREHHLFQSRPSRTRSFVVPESVPVLRLVPPPGVEARPLEQEPRGREHNRFGELHLRLLEQYAPASIVVNEHYDIVHLSGRAGHYLQLGAGELSKNLLTLIRPELGFELRNALYQAVQRQTNVDAKNVSVRIDERVETLNLLVRPVFREDDPARGFVLVMFEPSAETANSAELVVRSDAPIAQQLEAEVARLQAQLRASHEQYTTHAEELKAANEELQALNEELRSAAEELETSREELQSINEELRTVNQEQKVKVEETTQARNNLQNLVNSTNIGTIFLDRGLRVALFTPAATELFNLIGADYGRSLSDITHRLVNVNVLADAEAVLNTLQPIEREVRTVEQRVFLMRVQPYRTADDHIAGVVLTFLDITERTRAEEALRASEAKYRTLFETMSQGFGIAEILVDAVGRPVDYRMLEINPQFERLTGQRREQFLTGRTVREIAPELEEEWYQFYGQVGMSGEPAYREIHAAAWNRWFEVSAYRTGAPEQRRVAILYSEITERKLAEEQLRRAAEMDAFRVQLSDVLRPLADPLVIQQAALRFAAEQLNLDRLLYNEIDADVTTYTIRTCYVREGFAAYGGVQPMGPFTESVRALQQGVTKVVYDVETDESFSPEEKAICAGIQVRAFVTVPLVKDGRWVLNLVAHRSKPRPWTPLEVRLLEETAERTWAAVERARAEEALRQSEEQLRIAVTAAGMYAWAIDIPTMTHSFIGHVDQIMGFSRLDISNPIERISRFTVPEDGEKHREALVRTMRGESDLHTITRVIHPNTGALAWMEAFATLLRAADGAPLRVVGVGINITERKRRELNAAVLDEIGRDLAILSAPDDIMQTISARLGGFLGLSGCYFVDVDEANNQSTVRHGWAPDQGPSLKQTVKLEAYLSEDFLRTARAGEVFILRDTAQDERANAERYAGIHVGSVVTVPFLRDGRYTAHMAVSTQEPRDWRPDEIQLLKEISYRVFPRIERARAEEALHASEARFRTLTDVVPQVIWANDAAGKANYFNQRWYNYSGLSYEESVGPGWQAIVHPDDAPTSVERWQQALAKGELFDTEYRLRRADGVYRWHLGRNVPLRDDHGTVNGWFGSATDIEDLKQAEEALQRAHDELEIRVQERTAELQQLSTSRLHLLQRLVTAQEDERQRIARELHDTLGQFLSALNLRMSMVQSLEGMLPQVRDELAQLRVLAGRVDREVDRLTMELRPPALEHLGLADALHRYAEEWTATGDIPVDVLLRGLEGTRLPAVVETTTYRIVQEALSNVLKHAQASSVSIILERRASELRVIIEDDGVGFDMIGGTDRGVGGRQLGLIGMAERAALAGGELRIESEAGAGTAVYLRLPLSDGTGASTGEAHG